MNGISALLIKETLQSSLTVSEMQACREMTAVYEPGSGSHQTQNLLLPSL